MSHRFISALVLGAVMAAQLAAAQLAPGAGAALRVAHFSPDAAPMTVTVAGEDPFGQVAYRQVSDYQPIPSGVVAIRIASDDTVFIDATLEVEEGAYYTIAALGFEAWLEARVYRDNLRPFPPANGAALRVLHALPEAGAVDVTALGETLVDRLEFTQVSEYFFIAPGAHDLTLYAAGEDEPLLELAGVEIRAGHVYTLFATGEITAEEIVTDEAMTADPPARDAQADPLEDLSLDDAAVDEAAREVVQPTPAQAPLRALQAPRATGSLELRLPPGALAVLVGPGGFRARVTSAQVLELPPGRYLLMATAPGLTVRRQELRVVAGETLRVALFEETAEGERPLERLAPATPLPTVMITLPEEPERRPPRPYVLAVDARMVGSEADE